MIFKGCLQSVLHLTKAHQRAVERKLKNKYFLLKWRHVNHQATPGLLFLSQIRHIIHRFREGGLTSMMLTTLSIKSCFDPMSNLFPLPVNRCWCLPSRRVWRDPPKKRPLLCPFSPWNVNLYFFSHREPSPGEHKRFWQLDVLEYNAISRWYSGKSSVIFPFGAGTARCQVTQFFVFTLNPYGRLWLHVHDTWTYRGVFNHWSNGETLIFTAERPRLLPGTGRGNEKRFFAVLRWIIFAPVFLWELYIEIDSVEEVGWGKRLSRNPGNEEPWSSFPGRQSRLPVATFTIKLKFVPSLHYTLMGTNRHSNAVKLYLYNVYIFFKLHVTVTASPVLNWFIFCGVCICCPLHLDDVQNIRNYYYEK